VHVVVEVAAVLSGQCVRQRLALGRHSDDADHRPDREADALVHLDRAVAHLEDLRHRSLHLLVQLPVARNQSGDTPIDRLHLEELDGERVPAGTERVSDCRLLSTPDR
jgi:hypothetical protein